MNDPVLVRTLAAAGLPTTGRFTAGARGLDPADLAEVPGWLRGAYPELFASEHLDDRLLFYEVFGDLALCAHHPRAGERAEARGRLADALSGRSHLDRLTW